MANFYLDIETTGLNSKKDKIITIQYQRLDQKTGKPLNELKILREWDSSEKEIIKKFLDETKITSKYPFDFIPIGYNLSFVSNFLKTRTFFYRLKPLYLLSRPFIDLKVIGILMNKGEFKGAGLNQLTNKEKKGNNVPIWYEHKEYGKIIYYIHQKTKDFLDFNSWTLKKMPELLEEFNKKV